MKTLQQQYLLIKEGKGNKEQFLKHARYLFPEFITVNNDYNTTTGILKGKGILTEAVGGIATLNPNKPDWFKIFDTNLREAVGVKDKEEYGDQNTFKASKETEETLKKANFDNADPKNIDNVYGQSFLMGYYTEMKDPKNADKTVDELKDIVLKNMSKDVTYYNTEAFMGTKGIGFKTDVVGGGEPVEPKGKYKSSGYGDMPKAKVVKEGLNESYDDMYGVDGEAENDAIRQRKNGDYICWDAGSNIYDIEEYDSNISWHNDEGVFRGSLEDCERYKEEMEQKSFEKNKFNFNYWMRRNLNEGKSKKSTLDSHIKEIEKLSEVTALESKINAIKEAIEMRENKIKIAESEDLADMVDESMVKKIKNEIKQLEKYKMQCEKQFAKLQPESKKPVVDNEEINENEEFDFEKSAIESASGDKVVQREFDDYDRPLYYSLADDNVHYFIGDGNNGKVIIKYNAETGERENIGDLEHYN